MVTGLFLVQADSEAFFLSNFFSGVSRSAARLQPSLRQTASRQTRQFLPHHPDPRRPAPGRRPSRHVKSLQHHVRSPPVSARHNTLTRTGPGPTIKLDYSGWTPIGFDEDLPAKLKRGIKTTELKAVSEEADNIVTIDTAIASAPQAQSDDLVVSPQQAAAAPYLRTSADNNINNNIIYIDSSNGPLSTYSVLQANNPAIAPPYEPSKPVFQSPQYIPRPAVPDKPYKAPSLTTKYKPVPAVPPKYEPLPAIPPPVSSPPPADTDQYPIVALITAESDLPEEEKFVQFSIGTGSENGGSPDSLPLTASYQSTDDNTRLVKDVSSGSVRVNPESSPDTSDELYYIYYQDPELDPSFGAKIQSERDAKFLGLDGLDIPLYDYDEAQLYRPERDQSAFGLKSSSSVSFKQRVNGRESGFSYSWRH